MAWRHLIQVGTTCSGSETTTSSGASPPAAGRNPSCLLLRGLWHLSRSTRVAATADQRIRPRTGNSSLRLRGRVAPPRFLTLLQGLWSTRPSQRHGCRCTALSQTHLLLRSGRLALCPLWFPSPCSSVEVTQRVLGGGSGSHRQAQGLSLLHRQGPPPQVRSSYRPTTGGPGRIEPPTCSFSSRYLR